MLNKHTLYLNTSRIHNLNRCIYDTSWEVTLQKNITMSNIEP